MERSKLENVKQEIYLSVIINNKFSLLPHVKMISCCINLKRQFLERNLRIRDRDINFSMTRPISVLLLNMHPQLGIPTIKMSSRMLKVFKENHTNLF